MSSAFEGLPKTPNLKLNKPGYDNIADIEALNENADILDAEIQGIKNTFVKSVNGINAGDGGNVDLGIMPIAKGGTGASTAEQARTNLGIKDIATYDVLPVANGGTGATTAKQACANIGALPTSGGAMLGEITRDTNSNMLALRGGISYDNGASLALYGKDETSEYAGGFRLIAHNGTNVVNLSGKPNGSLSWNGKDVENVNDIGDKYIRFGSGIQICWGRFNVAKDENYALVTFPVPFANNSYGISIQDINGSTSWTAPYLNFLVYGFTTTAFKISTNKTVGDADGVSYIAIGKWK